MAAIPRFLLRSSSFFLSCRRISNPRLSIFFSRVTSSFPPVALDERVSLLWLRILSSRISLPGADPQSDFSRALFGVPPFLFLPPRTSVFFSAGESGHVFTSSPIRALSFFSFPECSTPEGPHLPSLSFRGIRPKRPASKLSPFFGGARPRSVLPPRTRPFPL